MCGHASLRKLDDELRIPVLCGNCPSQWAVNDGPEGQALLGPASAASHPTPLQKIALSLFACR